MWDRDRTTRWLLDANKKPFDGGLTYKVHLPPNVPVNDFWAFTMYDTQTRSNAADQPSLPKHRQPEQSHSEER